MTGEKRREDQLPDLSRTAAYDYQLPPGRIARYPTPERDQSRLLVLPRRPQIRRPASQTKGFQDLVFSDLPSLVSEGDLLVVNESGVLPVRLLGRKPTGAECEVLLLRPTGAETRAGLSDRWEALVRPGSKLKPGTQVIISGELSLSIQGGAPGGGRIVRLETKLPVDDALERHGRVPLPPYLDRADEPLDRDRYQTVYARDPGSVAAPTAGLHFTPDLLRSLESQGVEIARISLHVGPGTFRPVDAETIEAHEMHEESWRIPSNTAASIERTRSRGGRVWAVGTTVVRTLETAAEAGRTVREGRGSTALFIAPGYRFRVVDALITNFHLPRSTLLMLVAAFAGYETAMLAYAHAVRSGYRFYSYGDAMVVSPQAEEGSS